MMRTFASEGSRDQPIEGWIIKMKKVLLLVFAAALSSSAAPPRSKLSNEVVAADPQAMVRVLIQWTSPADDFKDQKVLARGGVAHYRFKAVPIRLYTLLGSCPPELANEPALRFI